MTEREKMLAGQSYDAWSEDLVEDRHRARDILQEYNKTNTRDSGLRESLLRQLLGREHNAYIEPPFYCDYGYNIICGDNFYVNFNCTILDVNRVIIGDNVKLGPQVQIYTATHPTDAQQRISGIEMGYEINIGNNVWIGGGSILCPGVTIGDNSSIGAGSVVTRDIPPDVVAAGNPCKIIKHLKS